MDTFMRIGQAARQLGVHPYTLKRWERAGLVRPLRSPGGGRYYRQRDLARLLHAAHRGKSTICPKEAREND